MRSSRAVLSGFVVIRVLNAKPSARRYGRQRFCHYSHLLATARRRELMQEFRNVTVVKKANIYFDGKVTSRTVVFSDGAKKTLGIMLPGEYEFNTADKEIMEILAGELDVLLPGVDGWKTFKAGESFQVPARSKFSLKVKSLTDYCCSFISST
jgi:purine/pyrimidine-nucleoside phosphorylase